MFALQRLGKSQESAPLLRSALSHATVVALVNSVDTSTDALHKKRANSVAVLAFHVRHNLAASLDMCGRHEEAESEFRAVLESRKRNLGDEV